MRNEQGFSLVELLIVVAIIAIIAAIAVPSLLTSRMAANESASTQACRTLGSAEIAFAASNGQQYGLMAALVAGAFLDSRFVVGNNIGGYIYAEDVVITDPVNNVAVGGATPTMFGFTSTHQAGSGRYDYELGVDQVVRWGAAAPPNKVAHEPIGK
jgi:prepilin-type N-terminal cleavage/methylation domain-containing protein